MTDFDTDNNWGGDTYDAEVLGMNVARIEGRLVRCDRANDAGTVVDMWLAVEDEYRNDDGTVRSGWQALKVRADAYRLWALTDGCSLTLRCRYHQGRLVLAEIESIENCSDPLPEVWVPKRKTEPINVADGHLPDINEVDKAAKANGYGKLAHSVFKMAIPVHVVFAIKGRSQCLLGHEALAQVIIRQVVEAEPGNVAVIAVAVENHSGGHIHLLMHHDQPGGTRPDWSWSRFIGRVKALASRRIAALPGLVGFPGFQDGYSITAVHGGRQGAVDALAIVQQYVEAQQADESAVVTAGP